MKKVFKVMLVLIFVSIVIGGVYGYFTFFYNHDISYSHQTIEVEKSKYHVSGSWWGYNQKKLTSIGDVTFGFVYDNSNLDNGNSSETNPFECHFTMMKDSVIEIFDSGNANAPGNVLADSTRNKVYYILVEPVGPANEGGVAWTGPGKIVVYTYDFDAIANTATFNNKQTLTDAEDDGKQRLGAAINEQGQIIISYGSYDAMLNVFIYNPIDNQWDTHQTLSNDDNDSLMYNYAIIKDLDDFYVLAIQDTARNNNLYYQYVKFFSFNNDTWNEEMVVDYRETTLAQSEPSLVEHTEFTLIDDKIHIITRSDKMNEINYFIWDDNNLVKQDSSFIRKGSTWIKIVEVNDDLLFVYNYKSILGSTLEIYSQNKDKIVYCNRDFIESAYIYINIKEDETIQLLSICGSSDIYEKSKAYIYEINKIE